MATPIEEFTVDELARRARMTVRNVRAYTTRGILAPPRLEGRTGYYSIEHLQRLQLIRTLIDRGFTLSAVEDAILRSPSTAPGRALELLNVLSGNENPTTVMSRAEVAALASIAPDDPFVDALVDLGFAEWIDDDTLHVLDPTSVASKAAAVALGLSPATIIDAVKVEREHLRAIADHLVDRVSAEIVRPLVESESTDEDWRNLVTKGEALLPIATQVIMSMFQTELREAIQLEIGAQLQALAERHGVED